MRMEAAYHTAQNDSRRGLLAAPALNDNRTLAGMSGRRETPDGPLYTAAPSARGLRRFTLGVAAATLALMLTPVLPELVDQQAVQLGVAQPLRVMEQSAAQAAPEAVAPASTAQEGVTRAPAAFSDALAAAPAGAQCSVEAHSCSVAADDGAQAASSSRTALAYRAAQTRHSGQHHERL